MKRFFSKLMPVEGKIQEGDHAMKEDGTLVYVNKAAAKHLTDNWKRIGMVICDREISVGERVHYNSRNNDFLFSGILAKIEEHFVYFEEDRMVGYPVDYDSFHMCYLKETAFKVIGQVSDESKWVKEWFEFDENDLNWMVYHNDEDTFFYPISNKEKNTNDWRTTIAIKCPNCNIFH
jgi:hypothetical protein